MSQKPQDDLTEQQAADVFAEMAATLDAENGINQSENSAAAKPVVEDEKSDELPEPAASAQQAPKADGDTFDFNALPEAAQKRLQYLEQYQKSNEGRVGALQRQIDEQRNQLEQLQAQGKGDSQAAQQLEQSIEEGEINLGGLTEELPELAVLVEEVNRLRQQVKSTNGVIQEQVITPAHQRAAQEAEDREFSALQQEHPDLGEIVRNQAFWDWKDSQHESIRALGDSTRSRDVSALVSLYKKTNPGVTTPTDSGTPATKNIQRNVDDLIVLPSDGNGRSSSPTGDDNALWTHFAGLADAGKL